MANEKVTSLEIRLNSVNDAKAAVQNLIDIDRTVKQMGMTDVVFIVAKEHGREIQAALGISFSRLKPKYAYMACPPGRVLYTLPPFIDHQKPVPANAAPAAPEPIAPPMPSVEPAYFPFETTEGDAAPNPSPEELKRPAARKKARSST